MAMFNFDLAGAEWVLVAYLANDPNMIEVVRSGKSPHLVTGTLISGVPEELVLREHKVVGDNTSPDIIRELRETELPELVAMEGQSGIFIPRTMSIRQAGKKANHGLNYDMQYRRFALENEMPEIEARSIHNLYNDRAYPKLKDWRKSIQAELRKDNMRILTNPMGRKVRLLQEWSPELLDAAYAFKPQSTVADIVNQAMIAIYEDESRTFRPMLHGWAQKHDSLLLQYPAQDHYVGQWCNAVREYMSPELTISGHTFRLGVDLKVGYDWSNMKGVEFTPSGAEMRTRVIAALQQAKSSPAQLVEHRPDPEWSPGSDQLDQRAA